MESCIPTVLCLPSGFLFPLCSLSFVLPVYVFFLPSASIFQIFVHSEVNICSLLSPSLFLLSVSPFRPSLTLLFYPRLHPCFPLFLSESFPAFLTSTCRALWGLWSSWYSRVGLSTQPGDPSMPLAVHRTVSLAIVTGMPLPHDSFASG